MENREQSKFNTVGAIIVWSIYSIISIVSVITIGHLQTYLNFGLMLIVYLIGVLHKELTKR